MFRAMKVIPSMVLLAVFGLLGCKDAMLPGIDEGDLVQTKQSIINGEAVLGNDMLSTVMVLVGGKNSTCTGTLISPNYVLTAGHCISDCESYEDSVEQYRSIMTVGIGQAENDIRRQFAIEAFYPHPNFICTTNEMSNDIAILKLKTPVPLSLVTPTPPMPPLLDVTASELNAGKVSMSVAGFGLTVLDVAGTKYKAGVELYATCPLKRTASTECFKGYTTAKGFMYFDIQATGSGTCSGDSGGPTFLTRNGVEYVVGVSSFVYDECYGIFAATLVSDYYSFIAEIATDIAAGEPEICDNNRDDNGDKRIDCADPYCFALPKCIPEDCENGVDDNDNGKTDCADVQCSALLMCQEEICNNAKDDNGDSNIDCFDPECYNSVYCVPENCTNGIDDNKNDLVDCADAQCRKTIFCTPEVCGNGVDDNKNDLIDCADPTCAKSPLCLPEICDNRIDDNGDGKTDCDDVKCSGSDKCRLEDCRNGIDDTGNNQIDCLDPSCATSLYCKPEICDNRLDDNGNKLQDCDDPQCAESPLCVVTKEGSPNSCSATSRGQGHGGGYGLWAALGLLAFAWRRRSVVALERLRD